MSYETILLEVDAEGVAWLTFNRPEVRNALNLTMVEDVRAALRALQARDDVKVLVITGAGDKFFCSGGDIKQYRALRTREQLDDAFARPRRVLDRLEALPVPVIAAVNGYALGGGAELMLACDVRLAAAGARIGFPYVRLSLIPGWHGVERLVRTCGRVALFFAMPLVLTATFFVMGYERLQADAQAVLIDVRTQPEWAFVGVSAIERLIRLSWQEFPSMQVNPDFVRQIEEAGLPKDTQIFCICRSGQRSASAAAALTAAGFENCYNVAEGFEGDKDADGHRSTIGGWRYQGLPWEQC